MDSRVENNVEEVKMDTMSKIIIGVSIVGTAITSGVWAYMIGLEKGASQCEQ